MGGGGTMICNHLDILRKCNKTLLICTGLNASSVDSVSESSAVNPSCRPQSYRNPASTPVGAGVSTHHYGTVPLSMSDWGVQ